MAGISPWQLLIVLLIVLLIFGTKKLRNVGGDLGSAIRDFRKGMNESEEKDGDDEGPENDGPDANNPDTPKADKPKSAGKPASSDGAPKSKDADSDDRKS